MNKFAAGETITLKIWIKDANDVLVDPTTSTRINIWDSSGVLKADDAIMSSTGDVGIWYYHYDIPVTGPIGIWRAKYKVTSGTYLTSKTVRFAVVHSSILD